MESEESHPDVRNVQATPSRSDGADLIALVENLPDHFWAVDLDYRLRNINRSARECLRAMFGVALRPGMFLLQALPEERAQWWGERFKQVLALGQLQFEYEIQNQSVFDFHLNRICEDGKPTGIVVYAREMTAQKHAEDRLAVVQKKLQLSDARYRIAFENTPDAITINRVKDGGYIDCNLAFFNMLGYTREEVIGRSSRELNLWGDPAAFEVFAKEMRETGVCRNLVTRFRAKDGHLIWAELSAARIDMDGEPYILSVTRDVSAAKDAEYLLGAATQKLRQSEARYSAVFRSSFDGILILDRESNQILEVNPRFLAMLGYRREELVGVTALERALWADLQDRERWQRTLDETAHCRDFEASFRKKDGQRIWVMLSASTIEIDHAICTIVIARDITSAKAAENEIHTLAFYDSLTGLPNRRRLLDQLEKTLASNLVLQSQRALLFVDLDNFKVLNDTLGHPMGDLMLREVALRIAGAVRETDLVARRGGDEFVVMLDRLNGDAAVASEQARLVAEKILAVTSQPYVLDGHECRSSASIGITIFDSRGVNTDELLQQADIAMYEAKAAGRNAICFFAPSLQVAVNARAAIEEEMREGMRHGEFELFYQPQIECGRLSGVEALLRWRHPRRGLLPPVEFIGIAEHSGLILPLGEQVLEMACRQIAIWSRHPRASEIMVAVNISSLQLRQENFVDTVLEALVRTGADPHRLNLELTESMLVDNMEKVTAKMSLLKQHGIHFSLDDFGTGYSSLAYLKRLPLDQLKIDRTFIRDVMVDKTSGVIAHTIVALGRAMRLKVVAEGVETEEQCQYLKKLGCHCLQGFYFGRPQPLAIFEQHWLRTEPLPYIASPQPLCDT